MEIIPLSWDSGFFGMRIAKACVASMEDIAALSRQEGDLRNHFDLIYLFSEPGLDIPFDGARLVDSKAVFSATDLSQSEGCPAVVRWESRETSDSLVSLALVSGKYSRFKTEPRFPAGSYERLYMRWIEQSVNGSIATDVFCYMKGDCPRGLLTLDRRDDKNVIGLVAGDEDCQHQGIGTALIKHAVTYVHEHQGNRLSVATQLDNEPACRLYSRCGFSLESVTKIWHWWL